MHLWKRRSASSTLTLLFVGDSISHQHWLATVLLLRSHVGLQCPSLLAQWAYVLEGRPMPSWTLWALTSWSRLALRVFPQPRRLLGGSTLMTCAVLWPQGRRPRAPSWRGTRPWLKVCYAKAAMRNADADAIGPAERLKQLTRSGLLGTSDMVVVNSGVHYAHHEHAETLQGHARGVAAFAREWPTMQGASGRPPILLWRETAPQHFPSEDERVSDRQTADSFSYGRCAPLAGSRAGSGSAARASSQVLNRLTLPLLEPAGVPVLAIWSDAWPRWDAHPGAYGPSPDAGGGPRRVWDCTHFCLDSSDVVESWTLGLVHWVVEGARARRIRPRRSECGRSGVRPQLP